MVGKGGDLKCPSTTLDWWLFSSELSDPTLTIICKNKSNSQVHAFLIWLTEYCIICTCYKKFFHKYENYNIHQYFCIVAVRSLPNKRSQGSSPNGQLEPLPNWQSQTTFKQTTCKTKLTITTIIIKLTTKITTMNNTKPTGKIFPCSHRESLSQYISGSYQLCCA